MTRASEYRQQIIVISNFCQRLEHAVDRTEKKDHKFQWLEVFCLFLKMPVGEPGF